MDKKNTSLAGGEKAQDKNNPTYIAYQVHEREGDKKNVWNEIGIAWAHRKGEGFNLYLKAVPLDGKVVVMPHQDRTERTESK